MTPTLDQIRTTSEAKLQSLLKQLDSRHKSLLRQAIKDYRSIHAVPDSVWKEIEYSLSEQVMTAILLLWITADDYTTQEIAKGGLARQALSGEHLADYSLRAARLATDMAASSTSTIRSRLGRKLQDEALTGRGDVGEITDDGIDDALDDVFTQARRETFAVDATTQGISGGQMGARDRAAGGDGADASGTATTIELIWRTERDNLVCPRCAPLEGQPESVWGLVFPEGPGPDAHPNCRCELEIRVVPLSESLRESDEGHWVTINGNHVQIDGNGTILTGPMKGTSLSKTQANKAKKQASQPKLDAKQLAAIAVQKSYPKNTLHSVAAKHGVDYDDFMAEREKLLQVKNTKGYNAPLTDEQKQAAKSVRDAQEIERKEKQLKTQAAISQQEHRLDDLPQSEQIQARDYLRQTESPNEAKAYVDAALSFKKADPQKAAIDYAVSEFKSAGVHLSQKGNNYSWYGTLPDGRSVRIADHLGFESHDIEVTFERPTTKDRATVQVKDELKNLRAN